jgi:hypothetical protein
VSNGPGEPSDLVDLSFHNTNPPGVFDRDAVPILDGADSRLEDAVAAIREFIVGNMVGDPRNHDALNISTDDARRGERPARSRPSTHT